VVAARCLDHLFVALDGVERTQAVSLHTQSARVMIIMENSATEMIFTPRWYTVAQVAQLLNYGESKVRMLIITGQLRSIKDGRSRRILPEWVEGLRSRSRQSRRGHLVTSRRANGEGSIFPYRNGFAAYVWITTLSGKRQRRYVYGRTRETVHSRWVELTRNAARGPVVT
jgi:excisionase family DNA binding protein